MSRKAEEWTNGYQNDNSGRDCVETPDDPYDVIIVGGGQAGLCMAGRCKALGLKYLILEKFGHVGDVWSTRYSSLTWHTPKEYGELPFGMMFPEEDPVLIPTKRIGKAHAQFAWKYAVDVETGTEVIQATFDARRRRWQVHARQAQKERAWFATNLVLAMGTTTSTPAKPAWANVSAVEKSGFKGTVIHGSEYTDPSAWTGKKGIVIGTANTAADVAEDMRSAELHTTMFQRNPTLVVPVEWLHRAL